MTSSAPESLEHLARQLDHLGDLEEQAQRKLRLAKALDLVSQYTVWSGAAGLLPLPMLDLVTVVSVQAMMLHSLAKLYEVSLSKDQARAAVGILVSAMLSSRIGGVVASSLSKLLPGWSDYVGATVTSCVAGSMTYAMGRAFVFGFETGGQSLNFDAESIRAHFLKSFAEEKARRDAKAKSWLGF